MTPASGSRARTPSDSTETDPPSPTSRKAVLFCPDCDHRALVDGDWVVVDDAVARSRDVYCPECSRYLTSRPFPGRESRVPTHRRAGTPGRTAGRRLDEHWMAWTRLWSSTVGLWLSLAGAPRSERADERSATA
ncbi:MAG: hypothetical protein ABEJ31_10310 [Haloarculaceae archaeon]